MIDAFTEKGLLVDAGSLAFRAFLALIPALLFIVGLLGFFGFDEVWKNDIAPDVKSSVSQATFQFLDEAIVKVLGAKSFFWVTAGAALTAWEASAVVRAAGNMMDEIYEVSDDDSSFVREVAESIPVGAAAGALLLAAFASLRLGPIGIDALLGDGLAASVVSVLACWSVAAVLFFAAVALVIRFAPAIERPPRWLSFGRGHDCPCMGGDVAALRHLLEPVRKLRLDLRQPRNRLRPDRVPLPRLGRLLGRHRDRLARRRTRPPRLNARPPRPGSPAAANMTLRGVGPALAPVAQLDRASVYETEGHWFESSRAHSESARRPHHYGSASNPRIEPIRRTA